MKFLLNKKTNEKLKVISENDHYYQISDTSFVYKDMLENNSIYELLNENDQTQNNNFPIPPINNQMNNDTISADFLNTGASSMLNSLKKITNPNYIEPYDEDEANEDLLNSNHAARLEDDYLAKKQRELSMRASQNPYQNLQQNQQNNFDLNLGNNPSNDLNLYDNSVSNDINISTPNSNNDYVQSKINTANKSMALPIYSDTMGFTKKEFAELDMFKTFMKPEKRKQKLPFKFIEDFMIPRGIVISTQEDSFDLSFIDFIANNLVNELFENREVLVEMIKDRIKEIIPEYDEYGQVIHKDITSILSKEDNTTITEKANILKQKKEDLNREIALKNQPIEDIVLEDKIEPLSEETTPDQNIIDENYIDDNLNSGELNNEEK